MQPTKPTKEQVRAYVGSRIAATTPPPDLEEVRRQLGWEMIPSDEQPNLPSSPQR